jgi:predicted RNA-binding Zn-ribbon protein involved in translation (DUF1610 family)
MDYTCPLCGTYEGSVESVQAHISSKNDEAHKGRVGRDVMKDPDRQGTPQSGQQETPQSGQQSDRPGMAQGKEGELPPIECSGCGREVKYPELMPYKAKCPGCGQKIRKRDAFEETEKQADEPGNDETKGKETV